MLVFVTLFLSSSTESYIENNQYKQILGIYCILKFFYALWFLIFNLINPSFFGFTRKYIAFLRLSIWGICFELDHLLMITVQYILQELLLETIHAFFKIHLIHTAQSKTSKIRLLKNPPGLGIHLFAQNCSFKRATVSYSLSLLFIKEWP